MKSIQLSGFGNAILDILVRVEESDIVRMGLKKSDMQLVDADLQKRLLAGIERAKPSLVSGGALANSVIAFAQLGGNAAFSACIGDDPYGLHYQQELTQLGVELDVPLVFGEQTGTSLILITPDSERTMCTNLAVSATLDIQHLNLERIKQSEWLALEGYLLSSAGGRAVCRKVKEVGQDFGCKLAVTISAQFIASAFKADLQALVTNCDLVVANLEEARVFLENQSLDSETACRQLSEFSKEVVVTDGSNGASGIADSIYWHVPAVASKPRDLTGAGDMFTGVYLYGRSSGHSPEASAEAGCFMAHKVIEQIGARLPDGMPTDLFGS